MAFNVKFKVPHYLKSVKYCLAGVNTVFLAHDSVPLVTLCSVARRKRFRPLWVRVLTVSFMNTGITGLLLLIVGIVVLSSYSNYEEMILNRFFNIPAFSVATGLLIVMIAVVGYYGAYSQSFYFIAAYVVLLLVVLVFEIAIVIASFKLRNDSPTVIRATMLESLLLYSSRLDIARMWDELQMGFECCGVSGRFDYISSQIPVSCCHMDYGTISPFDCGTANAYPTGCAVALGEWLAEKANALAIVALIVTCIQVVIASASSWLAWRSKFEEVELEQ